MGETPKQRWPRAAAMAVAECLYAQLLPACERVAIAGSLRRGKPDVGMHPDRFQESPAAAVGGVKPRRFVKIFKQRFVPAVEHGLKTQTVRPIPRRVPRAGDVIECRYWSGRPYRSKQIWCAEGLIQRVVRCEICAGGIMLGPPRKKLVDGRGVVVGMITPAENEFPDKEAFARADGFDSWAEMWQWFCDEHKLGRGHLGSPAPVFVGVLIQWEHRLPDWQGKHQEGGSI